MASNCGEEIYSENYLDYLVEYFSEEELKNDNTISCYTIASNRFAIVYKKGNSYPAQTDWGIDIIPRCYGLTSSDDTLEQTGILKARRQPGLNLTGSGVLVGFVDTGIDYSHPAFIRSDGKTRIVGIWDQTEINPPEGKDIYGEFGYGVEYNSLDINNALNSDEPLNIVPQKDEIGHGTFMAGVACGNIIDEKEFSGAAPFSNICMVKCKQVKNNLRDFYFISKDANVYGENDIMLGVRYILKKAEELATPVVICIGMGTNLGGHNTGGVLGEMLTYFGQYRGIINVATVGNEANLSHHYQSELVEAGSSVEVEIQVSERERGFTTELWTDAINLYSIGLISPDGEYSGKITARFGERKKIDFLFGNTFVYVEYQLNSFESGDECIRIRFQNPIAGIWRVRVFNDSSQSNLFHMWLPIKEFLQEDTFYLKGNPDVTITDPGNCMGMITCAYYNGTNNSTSIDSGRGYTRSGNIKPDFSAPGINIYGPVPFLGQYPAGKEQREADARYIFKTGASGSGAVTAGATALLCEWAYIQKNDVSMDTEKAKKYFIRGANREGLTIPDRIWGNGRLDLYGIFDSLRPKVID